MTSQNIIIKKIFENRGYTEEYLLNINNSEHSYLKDVDILAAELKKIHDSGSSLTIYPDFDTDGVSSGTCLYAGLAELGFCVNLYIPDPTNGYGITPHTVDDLLKCYPDTYAILTCDTGITGNDAVDYCQEIGIKIFVTDHHKQKVVSNADVIVDPMRIDETYEHPYICGSFVAYQVLLRYAELYGTNFEIEQIKLLKVFAGIGTVSDTMPLLYENRQIVKDAINICRYIYGDGNSPVIVKRLKGSNPYVQAFWGLYSILCFYASVGIIHGANDINEEFFGFYLSPAINSVKRLNGDMSKAFGIFFASSLSSLKDNIYYIYTLNNERKIAVAKAYADMCRDEQPYAPYIYFSQATPGILGLLAQKVMAETGMPAFVLSYNDNSFYEYTGSGRSPAWYPCITRAGHKAIIEGHEGAFGCRFTALEDVDNFYNFLIGDIDTIPESQFVCEPSFDFVISPDWKGDVGIDISVFNEYLTEIDEYRPFGRGFIKPVGKLVFTNDDVVTPNGKISGWETMGGAHEHLKIHLSHGLDIICWNQGRLLKQKDLFYTHEVIGDLKYNEFQGIKSIIFDGIFVEKE